VSFSSLRKLAENEDLSGVAQAIDQSFFARLVLEPEDLLSGLRAVPRSWLEENPRYLLAEAIASAASRPYAVISERVSDRFREWVDGQDHPAARDVVGVFQSDLHNHIAAGRLSEAELVADRSLALIEDSTDIRGFDDILPHVFIRFGMVKLLSGDLTGALGIFSDAVRRAAVTGHPAEAHIQGYVALARALQNNFAEAEKSLAVIPAPRRPLAEQSPAYAGSTHERIPTLVRALIALGRFEPSAASERVPDMSDGEFWWVEEHIKAKRSLLHLEKSDAATRLEDVLAARRSLVRRGTLAGLMLQTDLADLYMAAGNLQAAHHVLNNADVDGRDALLLATQARLAVLAGHPEHAMRVLTAAEDAQGRRNTVSVGLLATKAAAERALGDDAAARVSIDQAKQLLLWTRAYMEVAEALPQVQLELAEGSTGLAERLPRVYVAQAAVRLTRREQEVLAALRISTSTKELAAILHVAPNTAKSHLASLYRKLGVHSRERALACRVGM
jgi:DNA-binding CsgD family transcriptional regulator